ncbi:REP-associated tyrosine transposase [Methylocaldum sp. MU1018]|jgi:REP element-mobilizing transposase RayT
MARPLRIELSGGLYHVTSRGDRREDIYFSDADREAWLGLLGRVCARFNWVCHAYCLMSNHYHLVIETPEGNLAQGMRQLNGVYTQMVNRTHGRVGHVFQGRYKAILVEKDSYLLELARYVVLNPVRAGMVGDVGDWPWSSYAAVVGLAPAPAWLQTHWLLGRFGRKRDPAIAGYIDFVRAGVGLPSIWDHLQGQIYLGSPEFIERMQSSLAPDHPLDEIPRMQRRPLAHYRTEYVDDPRTGMALAYLTGDYAMKVIAREFGVHYATVSRAVKAYESTHGM